MNTAIFTTPRIRVTHANAYQGTLVWGFPAPTAWVGLQGALNLRLQGGRIQSIAVVAYDFQPQVQERRFCPPRAPLGPHGEVQGFQETQGGYANLELALVFKLDFEGDAAQVTSQILAHLPSLRFAGGSLTLKSGPGSLLNLTGDPNTDDEAFDAYKRRWSLGSLLTLQPQLLAEHTAQCASKLEAWYDLFVLRVRDDSESWARARDGWLVPVTTGYQGVSPLYPPGTIPGVRDRKVPFQFVESIWDVGMWVTPSRLSSVDALFFRPEFNPDTHTYRCITESIHGQ